MSLRSKSIDTHMKDIEKEKVTFGPCSICIEEFSITKTPAGFFESNVPISLNLK